MEIGYLEIVKLITSHLDNKNPPDTQLWTPLHSAAYNGHLEIVKFLSEKTNSSNPHASQFWNFYTPLHRAAYGGHLDIVKYFVKNLSVNANEKSQPGFFGKTAYEVALQRNMSNISAYLIQFDNPKLKVPGSRNCNENEFECRNGECVESKVICDGLPPKCKDESDLQYCAGNITLPCVKPKYENCPLANECFIPDLKEGDA